MTFVKCAVKDGILLFKDIYINILVIYSYIFDLSLPFPYYLLHHVVNIFVCLFLIGYCCLDFTFSRKIFGRNVGTQENKVLLCSYHLGRHPTTSTNIITKLILQQNKRELLWDIVEKNDVK